MIDDISIQVLEPTLFSAFRQNANNLSETDINVRKRSARELYRLITTQQMSPPAFQQVADEFLKNILGGWADASQEVREHCILSVIELMCRCEEVDSMLPYVLSVLVERLNCGDLQGIKDLPEAMRPPPGQKPKTVLKLVQTSQEVRKTFCKLVEKVIGLVQMGPMRRHVDQMVNIIRALVMDPYGDIQLQGCNLVSVFCKAYKNILLHYTESLGRAVLLPLISKKSKIRIAALTALNRVLECGVWKYNAFVFQNLIGFKDPNSVAIKEFYEPTFNINYLASLIVDPSAKVREAFMNSIHFWICELDDRHDNHPKLVPYVLSGLFDQQPSIREIAFKTLEEIGSQIQKEKQNEFKESRQFDVEAAWTWDGKLISLPTISPFQSRPRLGSRFFVRGHIRGLWPAIFRQIKGLNLQHRKKAINLALMGIIYSEQFMTSHLDKFIPNFITSLRVVRPEDEAVANKVGELFYYIGRYCNYSSYIHIIKSGIHGQLVQNQEFIQSTFKALAKLMEGNLQAIPEGAGLCHKKMDISDLLNTINQLQLIDQIQPINCKEVEQLIMVIVEAINSKATSQQKQQLYGAHFIDLLKLLTISFYEQQITKYQTNIKEIGKFHINPSLLVSLNKIISLMDDYSQQVGEELKEIFCNPPATGEANFKFVVGLYVCLLTTGKHKQMLDSTVEILREILESNRIPQTIHFVLKLCLAVLSAENHQDQGSLVTLIQLCQLNFCRFKSYRKTPVYEQSKQHDASELVVAQSQASEILGHLVEVLQSLQSRNMVQQQRHLARIIYGYIKVADNFKRVKQYALHSVKPVWALLQRKGYRIDVGLFKHEEEFVLPLLIDYLVQRIETLESGSQMYNLAIGALENLFHLFPTPSSLDKSPDLSMYFPKYQQLFKKILKYCLNQKDIESKQKLRRMLGLLKSKMPVCFQGQYQYAKAHGMHQRMSLMEQVSE